MKDRKEDDVFTDPMLEVCLVNGETHSYPKYVGMQKDVIIQKKITEFFKAIMDKMPKAEGDDAKTVSFNEWDAMDTQNMKKTLMDSIDDPDIIDGFQEIVGIIIGKNKEWIDANVYIEDMVSVFALFLSEMPKRIKRQRQTEEKVLKILDLPTTTPSPVVPEKVDSDSVSETPM